jgi:hypothetical protein
MVAEVVAFAQLVDGYSNVVGIDLFNEWDVWRGQLGIVGNQAALELYKADLISWFNAVRAAGVTVPLTMSSSEQSYANDGGSQSYVRDVVDFFDNHFYSDPLTLGQNPINWVDAYAKPCLVGEFGQNLASVSPTRLAQYTSVRDNLQADARCAGTFAWAVADQGTTDGLKYGMFDNSGVRRADVSAVFDAFATAF